jgi:hypothetical protein
MHGLRMDHGFSRGCRLVRVCDHATELDRKYSNGLGLDIHCIVVIFVYF